MNDVSSNDNFKDQEPIEETSDQDVSGNDNEETSQTIVYSYDPIDYTSDLADIKTIGIFICGLLVAYGIAFAFFKGFKK